MPKIKLPRSTPSIDMTPMVDLAFLLVTFFMLTAQFRPEEAVAADTPGSISEIKIPEKDMMVITVDKDNRVFYNFDGQEHRRKVLERMITQKEYQGLDVGLSEEQIVTFSNLTDFGTPMSELKKWIAAGTEGRKEINDKSPGIPIDSLDNQLGKWLYLSRITNPNYKVAIKGDREANYETIKRVIDILAQVEVYKFNLVTDMETAPAPQ